MMKMVASRKEGQGRSWMEKGEAIDQVWFHLVLDLFLRNHVVVDDHVHLVLHLLL